MKINGLTESLIKRHVAPSTYKKGEKYYKKGHILSLERHGNTLAATIQGEKSLPDETAIVYDEGGILELSCNCQERGWCEHVVATLLGCLHQPEMIVHHPDLEELLQEMDRNDLKMMVRKIADNNSDMALMFVRYLRELSPHGAEKLEPATNTAQESDFPRVDPKPFAQKVRYIIKKYEGRDNDYEAISQISELVDEALEFITCEDGKDGKNALAVMEAIIQAYVTKWIDLDGSDGDTGLFFEDLDMAMAKSILCCDFSRDEKKKLTKKLNQWEKSVANYGIDHPFVLSYSGLQQGWDDPVLKKILVGKALTEQLWPKGVPEHAALFTDIRLEILDIQKRHTEYLHLALHQERYINYLMMLIQTGRGKEAAAFAGKMLRNGHEALSLAEALREKGLLKEAMEVARLGLPLDTRPNSKLALWLSERYEALGEEAQAIEYLIITFKEAPSLNDFLRIRELSDRKKWPAIRNDLLRNLGKDSFYLSEIIDIFIHEGLINKAITLVDKESYRYREVIRVLDAAVKDKPEWVIKNASRRAEEILDAANAKQYGKAVNFLKKTRKAYQETRAVDLWNEYREKLLKKHSRKSKFKSLMEKI